MYTYSSVFLCTVTKGWRITRTYEITLVSIKSESHNNRRESGNNLTILKKMRDYYSARALNNCCFIECCSSWIDRQNMFSRRKIWSTWRIIALGKGNDISHGKLVLSEYRKRIKWSKMSFKWSNNLIHMENMKFFHVSLKWYFKQNK